MTRTVVRDARVRADQLIVASGWSLLVTDVLGRIGGLPTAGLYVDNTRVVSREAICVDGREIAPFSCVRAGRGLVSHVELGDGEALPPKALYLIIERLLGEGMRTRLRFDSYAHEPISLSLGLRIDADFADFDEAETRVRRQRAPVEGSWDPSRRELRLQYRHAGLDRATSLRVEQGDARHRDGELVVKFDVPAGGETTVEYVIEATTDGWRRAAPSPNGACAADRAGVADAAVRNRAAQLGSSNPDVALAWRTAVNDLAALALGEPEGPAAPIAGLPLYQQIFGRDTLTASWQALLATPQPLRDSLRLNAALIGRRVDRWRDEEPGKMLHQARRGPLAALGMDPLSAYYGDWATVPDFLVFLGQYWGWTADSETVRDLLPAARSALDWMETSGDPDGDGFLEYDTRSPAGVKNQGWKDSDDAVVDADGRAVPNPLATSELQAYRFAALRHAAVVFGAFGHRTLAADLWRKSRALRRHFDRAYWMPDHGAYAMSLDAAKRQVRSVTSNDGHLLVSGIVPHDKGAQVASRLMQPDMFSGWGIRTLSAAHAVYNPFSYHRGSVWPVEQATAGLGFARYGQWDALHRVAEGMFTASALFAEHRLPETLSGVVRDAEGPYPAVYPKSCSPQAWSASCVIGMIQALLGLRPAAPVRTLIVDPHLPPWLPDLTLTGVRIGEVTATLRATRRRDGTTRLRVHDATGPLAVVVQPARNTAVPFSQRMRALRHARVLRRQGSSSAGSPASTAQHTPRGGS